jgi:phosphate starvation-inducible protein PhoH
VPSRRKQITPKTLNQKRYLDAVRGHDLVIAIGPAGTGKSYLAVAMAVSALIKREVARIILTRPAVEAGERLGFLPGDLIEKVHPYLRPLYDALYDMLEPEKVAALTEKGAIEIAPLAYMRGRTLNDAFIILDEAQNTTSEQMKMFLTRLGFNAKMVITGDITQVDLPHNRPSGPHRDPGRAAGHRRHPVCLLRRPRRGTARPRCRRSSAPTTASRRVPPPAGQACRTARRPLHHPVERQRSELPAGRSRLPS